MWFSFFALVKHHVWTATCSVTSDKSDKRSKGMTRNNFFFNSAVVRLKNLNDKLCTKKRIPSFWTRVHFMSSSGRTNLISPALLPEQFGAEGSL